MSQVKWLLERDTFGEDLEPVIEAIKRQGFEHKMVTYIPFEGGEYNHFGDDDCVICYGSLNWMSQIRRQKKWVGAYCTLPNFECTKYYTYFGKYLLNSDYIMMPLAELNRRHLEIAQFLGCRDYFVRPSTGFKSFTGQVVNSADWEKSTTWINEFGSPEEIIIISTIKDICSEYRFVVADKKVIAGSRYKLNGDTEPERYDPSVHYPDAIELAQTIAAEEWEPERLYVIDIGAYWDRKFGDDALQFKLVEINALSTSGWYDCDAEPIVRETSRIALEEWKDLYPST